MKNQQVSLITILEGFENVSFKTSKNYEEFRILFHTSGFSWLNLLTFFLFIR